MTTPRESISDFIDRAFSGERPEADRGAMPRLDTGEADDSEMENIEDIDADGEDGEDDEDGEMAESYDEASTVDDDETDDEAGAVWVPTTPEEVVALAYEWPAEELAAAGWSSPEEFLIACASDAKQWLEIAQAMGVPPEARPTERHLPGLELAVAAAGIPGARVIQDPLRRLRPGSPRRLW